MALRSRDLPFDVVSGLFGRRFSASGKLPVVEWDGTKIGDSSAILRRIDQHAPSRTKLFPESGPERDMVWLWEDWADESLYWHAGRHKFAVASGWTRMSLQFRAMAPTALRPFAPRAARRHAMAALHAQGLLRREPGQQALEFEGHLDLLDRQLEGAAYLVGNAITAADMTVAAMLGQLCVGHTPEASEAIRSRGILSAYLERIFEETLSLPLADLRNA